MDEAAVAITDNDEAETDRTPDSDPVDPDSNDTRETATDLGDITGVTKSRYPSYQLNGKDDTVDYYRFTITEPRHVTMGVRQLDFDASVTVEHEDGEAIRHKTKPGAEHVMTYGTMLEGTYYVRVETTEVGENEYRLAHVTGDPSLSRVDELRARMDPGPTPETARILGYITSVTEMQMVDGEVVRVPDDLDYYRFTLTESRQVSITLTGLDADAHLYLEDEDGEALANSENEGTADESIQRSLEAGTYHVRVSAQAAGENGYALRYDVAELDPEKVKESRSARQVTDVTVSFEQTSYTVSESDDTSTTGTRENEATVKVVLSEAPGRAVTIPITETSQRNISDETTRAYPPM